ncbi:putative 26S proteasome regulatory subunit [Yamadazyma tenuis]|uniref:Probable 26S proteasome regulatory subunit p27 n=1 Tax=Candida tenuis (strain ATCC 10573 / BCRC 21748 / CBS 615 / JCM 9827 / NBRC 10315 / NRRL Y-1498 / VKM Y-70) TaxID=590646 RepID=G3BAA4_CANTC|nr:putative 26S proteasome regulatory subunit [Yamadazyma tenuis ATCC 10573]EGV61392.1 putative 26S proteasome regulatory subunit [Yamadazyma tenuis ATCC 10573]WEJ92612.1 putative 26S proteasome regulatory subunit [Yamadazyma tenuis]
MTLEKDSFEGLMSSLNLDSDKFTTYKVHDDLNYQQLSLIKKELENQLSALFDILATNFAAEMSTPLVTPDGFPRDDIDVVGIRLVRVRIIRLRNDHKRVLAMIESKLQDQFKAVDSSAIEQKTSTIQSSVPFAVIEDVLENSPADRAGLQKRDRIVVFGGDIHAGNHNKLASVVARVQTSIDTPVDVRVLRAESVVELQLVPSNSWNGRGLLGCKIVPL